MKGSVLNNILISRGQIACDISINQCLPWSPAAGSASVARTDRATKKVAASGGWAAAAAEVAVWEVMSAEAWQHHYQKKSRISSKSQYRSNGREMKSEGTPNPCSQNHPACGSSTVVALARIATQYSLHQHYQTSLQKIMLPYQQISFGMEFHPSMLFSLILK